MIRVKIFEVPSAFYVYGLSSQALCLYIVRYNAEAPAAICRAYFPAALQTVSQEIKKVKVTADKCGIRSCHTGDRRQLWGLGGDAFSGDRHGRIPGLRIFDGTVHF